MRLLVAGRIGEIRGFALAGVDTAACDHEAQARAFVTDLPGDVGLLIVTAWVARAAGERLRAIRDRKGPPVVLTLPVDRGDLVERR